MNENRKPIIDPLLGLLRSRKFMVAALTLLLDVAVAYAPVLEPVRGDLLVVLTALGTALVAAIAYEDGKGKERTR